MAKRILLIMLVLTMAAGCAAPTRFVKTKAGEKGRGPYTFAKPKAGEQWCDPLTGIEFAWIEPGCFLMGQGPEEKEQIVAQISWHAYQTWYSAGESPRHEVCVDGFWMAIHEVTNAQYRMFDSEHNSGKQLRQSMNMDNQPVVMVSWDEAAAYARWLSDETDLPVRLPTEAEWEYAARGGTSTSRYWGNDPDEGCRFENLLDKIGKKATQISSGWEHTCEDGYDITSPVGSFLPNPFGLYDMLGNVSEWCADWYSQDYYATSHRENPRGPEVGTHRSIRGGAWTMSFPGLVRSAARFRFSPEKQTSTTGFRLVILESR